jgi:hypothetical protein
VLQSTINALTLSTGMAAAFPRGSSLVTTTTTVEVIDRPTEVVPPVAEPAPPKPTLCPLPWNTAKGRDAWVPLPLDVSRIPSAQVFSTSTWLGKVDRFELVKALRQASRRDGPLEALTEDEMDTCVRKLEEADVCASRGELALAQGLLREVLWTVPNCPLVLYRWGSLELVRVLQGASEGDEDALCALRAAVALEPEGMVAPAVDAVLRLFHGVPCPSELLDATKHPKSSGDVRVLAELCRLQPKFRHRLAQGRRADRIKALDARTAPQS